MVPSGFVCRESWPNQIEPSDTDLVDHHARAVVEDVGDVAQRAQVVLDRPRTGRPRPRRTRCTRRRCRRSTGSPGSRRRSRSPRARCPAAPGTACPGWSSGSAGSRRVWVRSARFCLPQSIASCTSGSPGSESLVMPRQPLAGGDLRGELRRPGPAARWASSCRAGARPSSEPATRQPDGLRAAGRQRQRVGQLAAGAVAERAVVALRRLGVGRRARLGAGAAVTGLRSPELVADRARVRRQRGADERRVVVHRARRAARRRR